MATRCVNLELNLSSLFLGESSATLIAEWIKNKEIRVSKLKLNQNQLGDKGLKSLAQALSQSDSIYFVDFSQNGISNRCASSLYEMLRFNESIVHLDIGSTVGSHPNRIGKEVC